MTKVLHDQEYNDRVGLGVDIQAKSSVTHANGACCISHIVWEQTLHFVDKNEPISIVFFLQHCFVVIGTVISSSVPIEQNETSFLLLYSSSSSSS
jgi:hypothetical protein